MSLFALFDIGRSGINASQRGLATASNNIANVNTPGYSRQDVILRVANPIELNGDYIGRGVGDTTVRRTFDNFTYVQLLGQSSSYGNSLALEGGLNHVEQIFNEAQDKGLLNFMQQYFNSWQDVSDNASDPAPRTALMRNSEAFINAAKQIEADLVNTIEFVNDEVGDVVDQINVLTTNIATVNGNIQQVEAGGSEVANTFRDERERMMKELAQLIDYDWNENVDGTVTVVAARRSVVAGVESFDFTTALTLDGDRDVFSSGTNITSYIDKGELGGYISLREDLQTNTLNDIRKLVASVIQETNYLHYRGTGLDDSTGNNFFSTLQVFTRDNTTGTSNAAISADITSNTNLRVVTLDEYDLTFSDSTNFQIVNRTDLTSDSGTLPGDATITVDGITFTIDTSGGAPAAGDTFYISPVSGAISNFSLNITDNDEIAASDLTTAAGANRSNNAQANALIAQHQATVTNLGGITFEEYYGGLVTDVGSMTKAASDNLEFDENLLFQLESRRESISGVSLDEEAANLIRYQRAFEAGARIIKITDELLELVINL